MIAPCGRGSESGLPFSSDLLSRDRRKRSTTRILIPALVLTFAASASVPVRDACSEDGSLVATIQETDAIQIRHAVAGESVPCYAVSVKQASGEVQGFIISATLPAIQEFERTRALESRVPLPPAPPSEGKKPSAPMAAVGPAFQLWSGADTKGRRMQIDPSAAKVTLVTFWAIESGAARRYVEKLMHTDAEFRAKGLRSFGFMQVSNPERAKYYLEDMGLDFPQAYDREKLGAKYNADASKGTTLVVDASNRVVAISSNPVEIRAAVARLLSLE
jgi:Redoxin